MRITDFDIYRDILKEKTGMMLEQDHSYLLDSRLMPIAKKWGYPSLEAMTASLHVVPDKNLVYDVVETMMNKETSFFRDTWPFHMIRDEIFPALKKSRSKKLKILCLGAATGQEPYSLCILFKELGNLFSGWKLDVLSTDICTDVLEQSKTGIYSQFEVQRGLPIRLLLKHFKQVDAGWQISSDIRKMVRHQSFNVLDNMAPLGKFDIILCRNVLSQFDNAARHKILEKIGAQLEQDGYLLMGKGEIPPGEIYRPLHAKRGLYVRQDSPVQTAAAPLAKTAV